MRKIINGKRYDTETAEEIGTMWNGLTDRDFGYCCETLYKKRGGEYFLHGVGGAQSKYAALVGTNSWSGSSKIIPMTYDEAHKWAEGNLDADEYEAAFGAVDEDDEDTATRKTTCITLPEPVLALGKQIASERGLTLSALVETLINGEVAKR